MKKKSKIILGVCIVAAALIGMSVWNTWFSPTKIAFINFQTIQQGSISKANDNSSIKLCEVSLDNLDRLNGYDMVFINGSAYRRGTTSTDTTGCRQRYSCIHFHGYQPGQQYL